MGERPRHQDDCIAAVPQFSGCTLRQPLSPRNLYEARRETRRCNLPVTLDRKTSSPHPARSIASDSQIVSQPTGIPGLPINTGDLAEILAESVSTAEKVEEKTGRPKILVAEACPSRQFCRRFLPCHVSCLSAVRIIWVIGVLHYDQLQEGVKIDTPPLSLPVEYRN